MIELLSVYVATVVGSTLVISLIDYRMLEREPEDRPWWVGMVAAACIVFWPIVMPVAVIAAMILNRRRTP